MGSPTKTTKVRKALSKAKKGKARKNALANKGSTAKNLPLNMPNASELKQSKAKQSQSKAKAKQSQSKAKAAAAKS
jgi:hypothetical protein